MDAILVQDLRKRYRDVQALDDECYQLLLRAYPGHRHLMGPPPPPSGPSKQEEPEPEPNKQTRKT